MYTVTGISIVVQHLRKKTPLTLYLDATGNVASKVPSQTKRLLYYSLTLPGGGQNAPPLQARTYSEETEAKSTANLGSAFIGTAQPSFPGCAQATTSLNVRTPCSLL